MRDALSGLRELKRGLEAKATEFADVIKMGRTQLQDAVPMTLGQEFSAYAVMLGEDIHRIWEARQLLREMNLGATAIGTGINSPPGYTDLVREHLNRFGALDFVTSTNLVEATQDAGVFVQPGGDDRKVFVQNAPRPREDPCPSRRFERAPREKIAQCAWRNRRVVVIRPQRRNRGRRPGNPSNPQPRQTVRLGEPVGHDDAIAAAPHRSGLAAIELGAAIDLV